MPLSLLGPFGFLVPPYPQACAVHSPVQSSAQVTQHRVATPRTVSQRQLPFSCVGHLGELPGSSQHPHGPGKGRCPDWSQTPPLPAAPQFSLCLTAVFLLQLAAGILGFVFSDKVMLGARRPPQV